MYKSYTETEVAEREMLIRLWLEFSPIHQTTNQLRLVSTDNLRDIGAWLTHKRSQATLEKWLWHKLFIATYAGIGDRAHEGLISGLILTRQRVKDLDAMSS